MTDLSAEALEKALFDGLDASSTFQKLCSYSNSDSGAATRYVVRDLLPILISFLPLPKADEFAAGVEAAALMVEQAPGDITDRQELVSRLRALSPAVGREETKSFAVAGTGYTVNLTEDQIRDYQDAGMLAGPAVGNEDRELRSLIAAIFQEEVCEYFGSVDANSVRYIPVRSLPEITEKIISALSKREARQSINAIMSCDNCDGTGGDERQVCPECRGSGEARSSSQSSEKET